LGGTRLVAVDGPSGAGKTEFAARLAGALSALTGEQTPIVHTDDLLDGWDDQLTFWPRLVDGVLEPLAAGRPGRYHAYDWHAARFGSQWRTVAPAPAVLVEGFSSARAEIRPRLTLAVFVTAPDELRLARVLARDGPDLLPYLRKWRRIEELHFAADATAAHADLLVDGAPRPPHDPDRQYVRFGR
jgi:uridine kinase